MNWDTPIEDLTVEVVSLLDPHIPAPWSLDGYGSYEVESNEGDLSPEFRAEDIHCYARAGIDGFHNTFPKTPLGLLLAIQWLDGFACGRHGAESG